MNWKICSAPFLINLFTSVINEEYRLQTWNQRIEYKLLLERLSEAESELATARKLLLEEEIETADYRSIKSHSEKKINILEGKLTSYSHKTENIEPLLQKAENSISCLDKLYEESTVDEQDKSLVRYFLKN